MSYIRETEAAVSRELRVPPPPPAGVAQRDAPQIRRVVLYMPTPHPSHLFPGANVLGPGQVRGDLAYADLNTRLNQCPRAPCEPPAPADVPGQEHVCDNLLPTDLNNRVFQFPRAPCEPPSLDITNPGRVQDWLLYARQPSTLYGMPPGLVSPPELDSSGQAGCGHGSREQQVRPATFIMQPECRHFHQYDASWNPFEAMTSMAGGVRSGARDIGRGSRTMGNKVKQGFFGFVSAGRKAGKLMGSKNKSGDATST